MMLRAFPSSQSTLTADSAKVYAFAVADCSVEGVKMACRALVRGEADGMSHTFAPSAPELAVLTRKMDEKIRQDDFNAKHLFVTEGTALWRKLEILKGEPQKAGHRGGKHFTNEDIAAAQSIALPPPPTEDEMAARRAAATKILERFNRPSLTPSDGASRAGARVCACEGDCQCEPEKTE